ncbi:MAG TPA: EamA family transporter [Sphingobacteriaceae bacterium]|nr:EamA family transporter [Sphingobacteriaceae bacterium]
MAVNNRVGILLALLAATLWGVAGTFGQFLFQERAIDVKWMLTIRLLGSGVLLLLYGAFSPRTDLKSIWTNKKDVGQLILFSITGITAVQYTYFEAISHSNAATATILQYVGPVMIVVYLAFKNKRMPRPLEILAVILAVIGTFLLVTHGRMEQLAISKTALFFGLAAAVSLAIYTLQPIPLLRKYGAVPVLGWGMLMGGVLSAFFRAPWEVSGIWDSGTYLATVFIVLLGTAIAFLAYLNAVRLIGGQKTSLLASAEPLSATIMAVLWLQVPFGTMDWIGAICIISTVFLLSRKEKP